MDHNLSTIDRLVAIEDIRQLKARYLNGCDRKDAESLLDCFAPGPVQIDMGHVGVFDSREAFVELFVAAADHPYVLDMHHGANPEIDVHDAQNASGVWGFDYRNVNTQAQTVTLASGFYHDDYVNVDGAWKISACRVTYVSAIHLNYEGDRVGEIFTGRSVAGVVSYGE